MIEKELRAEIERRLKEYLGDKFIKCYFISPSPESLDLFIKTTEQMDYEKSNHADELHKYCWHNGYGFTRIHSGIAMKGGTSDE